MANHIITSGYLLRCKECSSTLLPGSYKPGNDAGSLVCTHHFGRSSSVSQNGRPDLSKQPGMTARIRPQRPETPPKGRSLDRPEPSQNAARPQAIPIPDSASKSDSVETEKEKSVANSGGETSGAKEEITQQPPSTPPNPFDETDEDEEEDEEEEEKRGQEEDGQKPAANALNDAVPPIPLNRAVPEIKPVPAPRRPADPTPPPRPAPRNITPRVTSSPAVNGKPQQ